MLYYINKIKWKLKHQSLNNSYFKINRIKTLYIEDINSNSFLKKIKPDDYGIITGFNQIFKKNAINHFKALVNFHPSLLPLYRGPIPSYWCIKNVEKFTGFSLHEVSETIDCGTIIYQDIVEINSIKDPSKLDLKIARSASKVLLMYLDHLCKGTPLNPRTINAFNYYHNRVEYYSFQRQSKQ
ncbi:formyltransferase family protein [Desulfoluna spongiiphila]